MKQIAEAGGTIEFQGGINRDFFLVGERPLWVVSSRPKADIWLMGFRFKCPKCFELVTLVQAHLKNATSQI